MIFDFNSPARKIRRHSVGGKFYHLYHLNSIPDLEIPPAICLTSAEYTRTSLENRIDSSKRYAIRSSSTLEDDTEQSFAGIFESFLNISGYENIHKKVEECFRATDSVRARTYIAEFSRKPVMRVIIQEMIQPDISGVLFTMNPENYSDEIIVQHTTGIGDKVVSGQVSPDTVVINTDQDPAEPLLVSLKLAATVIKNKFNSEMDIEWAWSGKDLYILQARPLSFVNYRNDASHFWTRANIGEIIPKPLTPLSQDIFMDLIFSSYRVMYYSWL